MTKYVLPVDERDEPWLSLNKFTRGYVEAAFFCECNEDDGDLGNAHVSEIAPEAWEKIKADCAAFQAQPAYQAALAGNNGKVYGFEEEQAGRDYWYTRNGHGVGFWAREADVYGPHVDALTEAAGNQEIYVHRGDDGRIYFD